VKRKRTLAALAILIAGLLTGSAVLYYRAQNAGRSSTDVGNILTISVTQWRIGETGTTVPSTLLPGKQYHIDVTVTNKISDQSTGPTYMKYIIDAGDQDFRLSYMDKYQEANMDDPDPTKWCYGNEVKWYEEDTDGDGRYEVIGYCPQDNSQGGYDIPAGYSFTTRCWFQFDYSLPSLSNIRFIVEEHTKPVNTQTGVKLPEFGYSSSNPPQP